MIVLTRHALQKVAWHDKMSHFKYDFFSICIYYGIALKKPKILRYYGIENLRISLINIVNHSNNTNHSSIKINTNLHISNLEKVLKYHFSYIGGKI